jgi:hypothetical protein
LWRRNGPKPARARSFDRYVTPGRRRRPPQMHLGSTQNVHWDTLIRCVRARLFRVKPGSWEICAMRWQSMVRNPPPGLGVLTTMSPPAAASGRSKGTPQIHLGSTQSVHRDTLIRVCQWTPLPWSGEMCAMRWQSMGWVFCPKPAWAMSIDRNVTPGRRRDTLIRVCQWMPLWAG